MAAPGASPVEEALAELPVVVELVPVEEVRVLVVEVVRLFVAVEVEVKVPFETPLVTATVDVDVKVPLAIVVVVAAIPVVVLEMGFVPFDWAETETARKAKNARNTR